MTSTKYQLVLRILATALGLLFAFIGTKKLFTDWEWARQSYLQYHPLWVYYASGAVELVCGLGLVSQRTRFVSGVIMILMIAGVAAHPWRGDTWKQAIVQVVTMTSLLIFVTWSSRPK